MMLLSDRYKQIASGLRHVAAARTLLPGEMYGLASMFENMGVSTQMRDKGTINTAVLAIDFSEGMGQVITLTQNTLVSLNNFEDAPNYLVIVGAFSPTFSGVLWNNNVAPTPTATAGKADVYEFIKIADHIIGRVWVQGINW